MNFLFFLLPPLTSRHLLWIGGSITHQQNVLYVFHASEPKGKSELSGTVAVGGGKMLHTQSSRRHAIVELQ